MNKKILIVDDDAMNLRRAEYSLKQKGYEILLAKSGMECLLILRDEKVDLILLDIEMPIMSGIRTLEVIKDNKEFANIPVLFLTAVAESESVIKAGILGVVDYIRKPFMPEELLKRVNRILN